jgi:hypothetical protein
MLREQTSSKIVPLVEATRQRSDEGKKLHLILLSELTFESKEEEFELPFSQKRQTAGSPPLSRNYRHQSQDD